MASFSGGETSSATVSAAGDPVMILSSVVMVALVVVQNIVALRVIASTFNKAKSKGSFQPGSAGEEPAAGIQGGRKIRHNFYAQMYVGTSTTVFLGGTKHSSPSSPHLTKERSCFREREDTMLGTSIDSSTLKLLHHT